MRQNPSISSDLQSKNISQNLNISLREVDLNFNGYKKATSRSKEQPLILTGVQADVNRVLFWLSSKRNDYVRSYLKGGILYDLLGEITHEPNLDYWKEEITRRFNEEFK